jgi:hypothetical protein
MPVKHPTPPSEPTAVSLYDYALEAMEELERAKALIGIIQSARTSRRDRRWCMTGVLLGTEAAYYLRTAEDAIHALVREQAIPFHKQGRRHLCVHRGDRSRACGMTEG